MLHTLNIRDVKDHYKVRDHVVIKATGENIFFAKQDTGYGIKHFFKCPKCGARRENLYIFDSEYVYCRSCCPRSPYNGIQNSTRGGETEISYRMKRIAKQYRINYEFPFRYYEYIFDRPKYMRVKKWQEGLRKMQILENMRFQVILYGNKYKADLINRIFKNCLYVYSLKDIHRYIINWPGVANTVSKMKL